MTMERGTAAFGMHHPADERFPNILYLSRPVSTQLVSAKPGFGTVTIHPVYRMRQPVMIDKTRARLRL